MFKKVLLSVALLAAPVVSAGAQTTCDPNIFTNVTVISCSGFFTGNGNSGNAGNAFSATQATAMLALTGSSTGTIVDKVDYPEDAGSGNFNITLYGLTVIGYHWGNYPDNPDVFGNVSAYYLIDAGVNGTTNVGLTARPMGLSNGVVLRTGTPPRQVPEPASFALVSAGLLGLGAVARRRKA